MEGSEGQKFSKLLVAHDSPENGCWAPEGDILFPPVPTGRISPGAKYSFLSAQDPEAHSRFGWVRSADHEFTVTDFCTGYVRLFPANIEQPAVLQRLFEAVDKLAEDTPVAGSFFRRGVEIRRVELGFHKVFFHRPKSARP